ncbi:MAG TPA: DoxX family membrane protein [Thermoleophilaceae bacterium]
MLDRILRPRVEGRAATAALAARVAAGVVFVVFGIGKFTAHATEVDSFTEYGLPSPGAFVYAIGVLEIVGGLLLIAGLLTRLAALALAGDMVGAIIVSGLKEGEAISLTLAPALLVTMLVLLWTGAAPPSLDGRISRRGDT